MSFTQKSILISSGSSALSESLDLSQQVGLYCVRLTTGGAVTTAEQFLLKLTKSGSLDKPLFSQAMQDVDTTTVEQRWNPSSPVSQGHAVNLSWANTDGVDWELELYYEVA